MDDLCRAIDIVVDGHGFGLCSVLLTCDSEIAVKHIHRRQCGIREIVGEIRLLNNVCGSYGVAILHTQLVD